MKLYLATPITSANATEPIRALWINPKSLDERKFKVGQDTLKKVFASISKQKNQIPLMYAHGKDPAKGQRAAGWLNNWKLNPPEDPIEILASPTWTKLAKKEIDDEEWGYVSPGLDATKLGPNLFEPTGIFEISLTNIGVLDEQEKIAADRTEGGMDMDIKKLALLAGLPETATEEELEAAMKAKFAAPPPPAPLGFTDAQVQQLGERLGLSKLTDAIVAGSKKGAEDIIAAERKTNRVKELLERGTREGKITAAMRAGKNAKGEAFDPMQAMADQNPDAFEAFLASAPKISPVRGTFPDFQLSQDAIDEGKATKAGAFAKADLSQTETRQLLDRAARKLIAESKTPLSYSEATTLLTNAN